MVYIISKPFILDNKYIPSHQILLDAQDNTWLLYLPKPNLWSKQKIDSNTTIALLQISNRDLKKPHQVLCSLLSLCSFLNLIIPCCKRIFFKNALVALSYMPYFQPSFKKHHSPSKSISMNSQCYVLNNFKISEVAL